MTAHDPNICRRKKNNHITAVVCVQTRQFIDSKCYFRGYTLLLGFPMSIFIGIKTAGCFIFIFFASCFYGRVLKRLLRPTSATAARV